MNTAIERRPDWSRLRQVSNPIETHLLRREILGQLVPGAARALADRVLSLCRQAGKHRESDIIRHIHKLVEGEPGGSFAGMEGRPGIERPASPPHPMVASYIDPAFTRGRKDHPLKFALSLYGDRLKDQEKTWAAWAAELAEADPGAVIAEVAKRTADRRHNDHLAVPLKPPEELTRLEAYIRRNFGEITGSSKVAELAERCLAQWPRLAKAPEHEIVKAVAGMLVVPGVASRYTDSGHAIDAKDPRREMMAPRLTPDEESAKEQHMAEVRGQFSGLGW